LLLLLLPAANYFFTIKREVLPKKRDLLFVQISSVLLAVGNLVVGLAPISSVLVRIKEKKTPPSVLELRTTSVC
jgi:hypothetical protein